MPSARALAALLAAAASLDALAPFARLAGFSTAPLELDAQLSEALGLAGIVCDAHIVHGSGALRALLVSTPSSAPLREQLRTIASRLSVRAPHLLWLLFAAHHDGSECAIAAWIGDIARPRVSALVVDRQHVLASDVETLQALSASPPSDDVLAHLTWVDLLGRQALGRRFYRALERAVHQLAHEATPPAPREVRAELALLITSRLLFLSFLETKGWLDGDRRFLARTFERCMERGGDYHRRVLLPLCFGTLNTPPASRAPVSRAFGRIPFLNGGLFAPTPLEARTRALRWSDDSLGALFEHVLGRYHFTPREEYDQFSEAAIDPEMLGKAFESLMASVVRQTTGAFYTPRTLVARVCEGALVSALAGGPVPREAVTAALQGTAPSTAIVSHLATRLAALHVLDPACGSGAFLVHVLERSAELAALLGDPRPTSVVRREFLTRSIFGVDVNPTAVWLCELRLWLSVVVETEVDDPMAAAPLPNLDRHVRVGDSLSGDGFAISDRSVRGGARMARLRERYARATGARKHALGRTLERAERSSAIAYTARAIAHCTARRRDLLSALRGRDLFGQRARPTRADRLALLAERSRARELARVSRALRGGAALPFSWPTHFPDVARAGGFDVVIGNPPWVRLHRIPAAARATLRARYKVFASAAWVRGASAARAGVGFAAQVDLAALFTERALDLTRDGGTVALLLPAKLWHSLAGGGVRRLLRTACRLRALEDWSESPSAFDAAVYPSLMIAMRALPRSDGDEVQVAWHRRAHTMSWRIAPAQLALDADPASPWLSLPPPARDAFDRLAARGAPLGESAFGVPQLGVKCGLNDAFVVRVEHTDGSLAHVCSGDARGTVEVGLLRPLVRGEHVAPWRTGSTNEWIVWTHDATGAPLSVLPPHARSWLGRWQRDLRARSDAQGVARWWSLFRTASAANAHARVVWPDVARSVRAQILPPGSSVVPLNSCYVARCPSPDDSLALAALLNSPIATAWLSALAEPARGGYRRYLAWTMALFPLPADWPRARAMLAPLAQRALAGDDPCGEELLDVARCAYRVRSAHVAPLLAWNAR